MESEINSLKQSIRREIKVLKSNFDEESLKLKSNKVISRLEVHPLFKNSNAIMLFWSMKDEVFTHNLIEKIFRSKTVILPSIQDEILLLKEYKGKNEMVINNQFGIPEPIGNPLDESINIDLIVIPGIAFDKDLNRLGRGKGFYDKLLKTISSKKIGICFDFQIINHVPTYTHDMKMDIIISENMIIEN